MNPALEIPFVPRVVPRSGAPLEPPMVSVEPRWEYWEVVRRLTEEGPLSEAELNAIGAERWELAGIVIVGDAAHFYFKRVAA